MNPILQVKLRFANENNPQRPMGRNLRSGAETTTEKIDVLLESLRTVLRFYRNSPKYLEKILIDVNYNDIIAKSNRMQELLKPSGRSVNDTIVGARFSDAPEGEENHIITHYVDTSTVQNAIDMLEAAKKFLNERLGGKASAENFNDNKTLKYDGYGIAKTRLRNIIIDCSVIDSFAVPHIVEPEDKESFLITFYKTELSVSALFEKLNIDDYTYRYSFYGDNTISVTRDLFDILNEKVPYMISMISGDLAKVILSEITGKVEKEFVYIPDPASEPTIGVIDTFFDEGVYFNKWVDNTDFLDDIERMVLRGNEVREHGTEVTSIIVDGPRLNPWLDDGCGRFKVRHFGVCEDRITTAKLIRKIRTIVDQNPDIHVWNLSLGTDEEISKNFISYDSAILDEIQAQKNVIFVVSGTNDNRDQHPDVLRIGSPADSLNAVVVNSVRRDGRPASYSRKGNVLSFFNKPDVSYYGGDYDDRIKVYSPYSGEEEVYGTSFAAPWISRKLCYLIDVMGFPREIAKALIIDSAAGWEYKLSTYKNQEIIGYGIVPIKIDKILSTDSEEIKFVVYGTSESYKTTNYAIPIPRDEDDKYPYIARAALCYFPDCTRSQGVDYTNRELSLNFGRIKANGSIDDINENNQDEVGAHVDERKSRKEFRKWENTKFISKVLKNNKPIKSYDERLWGLAITSKERLSSRVGKNLNFGAVITLREVNGVNRINDFVRACTLRGWIVNEIDVQNRMEIYNNNQEEIIFE
jgi:hypothetical protein